MKNIILALALGTVTLGAILFYPIKGLHAKPVQLTPTVTSPVNKKPDLTVIENIKKQHSIDVVFVLDTTGSMGGFIEAAKQKIWSIASTMASSDGQTILRMGIVAYRDRGDDYVTKVVDLTDDLDSAYAQLMQFKAQGGGDGPESVNKGLFDAVTQMRWSQNINTYKTIFLVGDAPAHNDYHDEIQYPAIATLAQKKDIVINSIQCGESKGTRSNWVNIAQLGGGDFFQVNQNGSSVAYKTPYDAEIAALSKELESTRLEYGDASDKKKQRNKMAVAKKLHAEASTEARVRRGLYNISSSGKKNLLGDKDLVDDIASGRVNISAINKNHLPETMQDLESDEIATKIKKIEEKRKDITKKIDTLGKKRQSFVQQKLEKSGKGKDSLDEKIYSTIRKQAITKGIEYKEDFARY